MKTFPLTIDSLAFGGNGVGRLDGKVCFVPFSCPGDRLQVRIKTQKRSYAIAEIAHVVEPGPGRTVPPCPHFGVCGGCDWQHVAYDLQLQAKGAILREALWRGARVDGALVTETVASPRQYGYRSRAQFKLFRAPDRLHMGFYRQGSHFVQDLPGGCPIVDPRINAVLAALRPVLAAFPDQARLPQINIDTADAGVIAIVNYIGDQPDRAAAFLAEAFPSLAPLTGLFLQTGRKHSIRPVAGSADLHYSMPLRDSGACTLGFRPGGFSQVNLDQNRALAGLIRRLMPLTPETRLLDLYCGNGNLSIPLAPEVASVVGIEDYPDSIAAAKENCAANGIANAEYRCSDTVRGIGDLVRTGQIFDTVILDPPRAGAADAVGELPQLKPDTICYISCDPSTLARDCGLLAGYGYRVVRSIPVDMFPQTYHLESVTLLKKG